MSDDPLEELANLITNYMTLAERNHHEIKRLVARLDTVEIRHLFESLTLNVDDHAETTEPETCDPKVRPQTTLTAADFPATHLAGGPPDALP